MKPILLAALTVALAAPAAAQSVPPAPAPAEAPQPARFSIDRTPISELAANPAARAAVEKHFPTLFSHPAYESIKTMTLSAIAPYSQGRITAEKLGALQLDLNAIE